MNNLLCSHLQKKYFIKSIIYIVISLVKMLISRNFCQKKKKIWENFRFSTMWEFQWSEFVIVTVVILNAQNWNDETFCVAVTQLQCVEKWNIYPPKYGNVGNLPPLQNIFEYNSLVKSYFDEIFAKNRVEKFTNFHTVCLFFPHTVVPKFSLTFFCHKFLEINCFTI